MKKILLVLCSFIFFNTSYASIENNVFKIVTHKYEKSEKVFTEQSLWSSVLIRDNTLITNAHVILDEDKNPYWYYLVCKTNSFEQEPDCKYYAKLLKYDEENDLALLEINSEDINWESVFLTWEILFSTWKLNISDDINIYWYPWIGWNTITYTKWKISWYQDWLYKTDANIDEGNSWWWAFDENDNMIWIPSLITSMNSTIWWIIPVDKINTFLENEELDIYENSKNLNEEFVKNLNEKYLLLNWIIKTLDIGGNVSLSWILDDFKYMYWTNTENSSIFGIQSKENKNIIWIIARWAIKNNQSIKDSVLFERLRKDFIWDNKLKCTKTVNNAFVCISNSSIGMLLLKNNQYISIFINGENIEKKDLINNMKKVLKTIKIKKVDTTNQKSWFNLWKLEFIKNDLYYFIFLSKYTKVISTDLKNKNYLIDITQSYDEDLVAWKIKNIKDYKEELETAYKENWLDINIIVKKNINNNYYLYSEDKEYWVIYADFLWNNWYIYEITLNIDTELEDYDNEYANWKKYFDNILKNYVKINE